MPKDKQEEIVWGIWPSRRSFVLSIVVIGLHLAFFTLWFEMLIARPPDFMAVLYRRFPLKMIESFLKLIPLLLPFYLFLDRIRRWPVWKRLCFFVALSVGCTLFEELAAYAVPVLDFDRFDTEGSLFFVLLSFDMLGDVLIFLTVLSALSYMDHILCRNQLLFAKLSEEKAKLAEEEKLRLMAELKALQSQINPHFLFNTLNSLAALVVTNAAKAENLIRDMSDWYRNVLGATRQTVWSIQNEIELVRNYLKIESVRLGKRLSYDIRCDEAAETIQIPPLILQPLVENAVKHAIAPSLSGGRVSIEIRGDPGRFRITVKDSRFDGNFVVQRQTAGGSGTGIENVKKRLVIAFDGNARFNFHQREDGTVVDITVATEKKG